MSRIVFSIRFVRLILVVCLSLSFLASPWALTTFAQQGAEKKESSNEAKRRFSAAAELQNEGLFDLAVSDWQDFVKEFPDDPLAPKARHYLGVCLIQTKKYDEAAKQLATLIENEPKFEFRDEALLNLGSARYSVAGKSNAKADFGKAADAYEQLLKEFAESKFVPTALFYLGEAYYAMEEYKKAADAYQRHINDFAEDKLRPDALYALGITQLLINQAKQAEATFDRYLEEFPDSKMAALIKMHKADALFDQKKYAPAEKLYAETAADDSFEQADRSLLQQAYCVSYQKKYGPAAELFASLPEKYPKSPNVLAATLAAGSSYNLAGNHGKAIEWLKKVSGKDEVTAAHYLARSYIAQNKPAEALAAVEKVLPKAEGNSLYIDLLMDQADALVEIPDRRKDSVAKYAAIAEKHPNHAKAPTALYYAAWAAFDTGDPKQALNYTEEYLAKHEDHELAGAVRAVAGDAYLATGEQAKAEEIFRDLLANKPDDENAERWKLLLGWSLYRQQKYEDTIAAIAPAIEEINASDLKSEAYFLIGSSNFSQGKYKPAEEQLQKSYETNPKSGITDNVLLLLSRAQRLQDKFKPAQDTARKLIEEFPKSDILDRANYHLAEYLYSSGKYKDAAEIYAALVENFSTSDIVPDALYWLGWSHITLNQHQQAIDALSKLISSHSDHKLAGPAHFARGKSYRLANKYGEAIADFDAYLATNPKQSEKSAALLDRGLAQMDYKKLQDAAQSFETILAENEKFESADKVLYNLAWCYKDLDKQKQAVDTFEKLANGHGDSPFAGEAFYHVGESRYGKKEYKQAAEAYANSKEKAAKAGEKDVAELSAHKLGWSHYHLGAFDDAHGVFADQVKSYPNGKYVREGEFMAAECLYKQDDFENALAAFKKVQANPPSAESYKVLALLHGAQSATQQEQWDEALAMVESALESFPETAYRPELLYEKAWSLKNKDQLDDAMKLFEEITDLSQREVACRARLMVGEIHFEKGEHKEAIREFFRVFRGYKGAPASYDRWKAQATYETARCFEVLKTVDSAKKFYQEVLDNYPKSQVASLAKQRLDALEKL